MCADKMHSEEADIDAQLVRTLLAEQFPQWADLPVELCPSSGTDNAMYRLGEDKVVRLPRVPWTVAQLEKEQRWLPQLAPALPLVVPVPLALGKPGAGYPWPWSVYTWLDGVEATADHLSDLRQAAEDLAGFLLALRSVDATDGPVPGDHNFGRGVPLADRDANVRAALAQLTDDIDTDAAAAAWEAALRAPRWEGAPVWIHGDLQPSNLLAVRGRLSGVIDFGGLGVGDPACDLLIAWNLFFGESRAAFRAALAVDDATWARGRGWALSVALIALPYYRDTNPAIASQARHVIDEVLADHSGKS